MSSLKVFIRNLLSPIVPKQYLQPLLSNENMKIWTNSFTHESYDPMDNLEKNEYLGDLVIECVFIFYLTQRFPNYTREDYSNIRMIHQSGPKQAQMAERMGLHKHAKVIGAKEIVEKVKTDLYEAFIGALFIVGNSLNEGLGFSLCYNLFLHYFDENDITSYDHLGAPRTAVEQLFSRFQLGEPVQKMFKMGSKFKVTLFLTDEQLEFLKEHGIVVNRQIGTAINTDQVKAELTAYTNALLYLGKNGVNKEFTEALRRDQIFDDPYLKEYADKAKVKATNEGFTHIEFYSPVKISDSKNILVELFGNLPDGSKELLSYVSIPNAGSDSRLKARLMALKQYVEI